MWRKLVYLVQRRAWWLAVELALIGFAVTFFIFHDTDLSVYYLPVARGDLSSGYVPYFAYWFLWPLAWLPTDYPKFLRELHFWYILLSYTWLFFYPILGTEAYLVELIFPAVVLSHLLYEARFSR